MRGLKCPTLSNTEQTAQTCQLLQTCSKAQRESISLKHLTETVSHNKIIVGYADLCFEKLERTTPALRTILDFHKPN